VSLATQRSGSAYALATRRGFATQPTGIYADRHICRLATRHRREAGPGEQVVVRKTVISSNSAPASRLTRHTFCELSHGSPHSAHHRHARSSSSSRAHASRHAACTIRAWASWSKLGPSYGHLWSHRPAPRPASAPLPPGNRERVAVQQTCCSPSTRGPAGRHLRGPHTRSTFASAQVRIVLYIYFHSVVPELRCLSRAAGMSVSAERRAMIRNRFSGAGVTAAAPPPVHLQPLPTSTATSNATRDRAPLLPRG